MVCVKKLRLLNFRNYRQEGFEFAPGINYIHGKNGHGKTNILEALFLLSTGRSFRINQLAPSIAQGEDSFIIEAAFERHGVTQTLRLHFDSKQRQMWHNQTKFQGFSQLLGLIPSVVYAPSDIQLISGSPQNRRRFLNLLIAQYDITYAQHLARYTKALKQRNQILKGETLETIELWEQMLIESGAYLSQKRQEILLLLQEGASRRMETLSQASESIRLAFHSSFANKSQDELREDLIRSRIRDQAHGSTSIGSHRDDFTIQINALEAKTYGSEGQKRTLITAIKLTEWDLLKEKSQTAPLFCIDDFGNHLDKERCGFLIESVQTMDQVFLTAPFIDKKWEPLLSQTTQNRSLLIENGHLQLAQLTSPTYN
ncbi:MAG: DNA replication and repair protein RecF [Chlamydiia bacterium]|nr:DNA replication and repair protein RecF [Chlamydiia bacterium]